MSTLLTVLEFAFAVLCFQSSIKLWVLEIFTLRKEGLSLPILFWQLILRWRNSLHLFFIIIGLSFWFNLRYLLSSILMQEADCNEWNVLILHLELKVLRLAVQVYCILKLPACKCWYRTLKLRLVVHFVVWEENKIMSNTSLCDFFLKSTWPMS